MSHDFFELADEPGNFNEEFFINYWHKIYKSQRGTVLVEMHHNEPIAMLGIIACQEMTTSDLIFEMLEDRMYDEADSYNEWKYIKELELEDRPEESEIFVSYSGGGSYDVNWVYDNENNLWIRYTIYESGS